MCVLVHSLIKHERAIAHQVIAKISDSQSPKSVNIQKQGYENALALLTFFIISYLWEK